VNAAKPPLWSMPTQFLSGAASAAAIAAALLLSAQPVSEGSIAR